MKIFDIKNNLDQGDIAYLPDWKTTGITINESTGNFDTVNMLDGHTITHNTTLTVDQIFSPDWQVY